MSIEAVLGPRALGVDNFSRVYPQAGAFAERTTF